MENLIIKSGDIISAETLIKIIDVYGGGTVEVDGGFPSYYTNAEELEMDGNERFQAVINYWHEVQFRLLGEGVRATVTTGLKGACEAIGCKTVAEWHAAADLIGE